jgi:hypothetical protein
MISGDVQLASDEAKAIRYSSGGALVGGAGD